MVKRKKIQSMKYLMKLESFTENETELPTKEYIIAKSLTNRNINAFLIHTIHPRLGSDYNLIHYNIINRKKVIVI